ncbi:hypothetical protein [Streptomyces sp. NPDC059994]|uniref:hypothetical protein n=1 Tax=Streptomyces sp. NPDC059994 TaxID=3347029 RepID=UPI00367CBCF6
MSNDSPAKGAAPLRCTDCNDEDGPFTRDGLCEDCTPAGELRSALEDGGHLNDNARRLMDAYAADVLRKEADKLRTIPGCEDAARIIDNTAQGLTQ